MTAAASFPWYCSLPVIGKTEWEEVMKPRYTLGLTLVTGIAIGAIAMQGLHAQTKLKAYSVGELEPIAGATVSPSYLTNVRKAITIPMVAHCAPWVRFSI